MLITDFVLFVFRLLLGEVIILNNKVQIFYSLYANTSAPKSHILLKKMTTYIELYKLVIFCHTFSQTSPTTNSISCSIDPSLKVGINSLTPIYKTYFINASLLF